MAMYLYLVTLFLLTTHHHQVSANSRTSPVRSYGNKLNYLDDSCLTYLSDELADDSASLVKNGFPGLTFTFSEAVTDYILGTIPSPSNPGDMIVMNDNKVNAIGEAVVMALNITGTAFGFDIKLKSKSKTKASLMFMCNVNNCCYPPS